jgi:hypothetical protein
MGRERTVASWWSSLRRDLSRARIQIGAMEGLITVTGAGVLRVRHGGRIVYWNVRMVINGKC